MAISGITLNIEGDRHFDRFVPVFNRIHPDVICLQEVFATDLPELATRLGFSVKQYEFLPMTTVDKENPYSISQKGPWGIAILSRIDHTDFSYLYYKGSGTAPEFTTPNSVDRGMLYSTFYPRSGQAIPLGTTHFTWTGDGESSPDQVADFASLKKMVSGLPPHVLCGDFNSPRGKETYGKFGALYKDGLPTEVTTTIDGSLHYAGELELVVDTVFYQSPLEVEVLEVLEGVSDHKGISFLVHTA